MISVGLLIQTTKDFYSLKKVKKTNLISQKITKKFAFHSLVAKQNMYPGEVITDKSIDIKRPGNGYFSCNEIKKLIGKKIKKKISKNTQFSKKNVS